MGNKKSRKHNTHVKKTVSLRKTASDNGRSISLKTGEPPLLVLIAVGLAAVLSFLWAYWPTLKELVSVWESQPDYSHGYLVAPLSLFFLWARRNAFPGFTGKLAWPGAIVILLSFVMRYYGAVFGLGPFDGWSMILWLSGLVWFLGGWRMFVWAMPAIGFLFFMTPLPYSLEIMLSGPLQGVATKLSTWSLQLMGLPAIAENHTILVEEHTLEVEQACSGLRIFMGIIAMAFAYIIMVRQSWRKRIFLLLSAVPVAIAANATRIVITAIITINISDAAGKKFTHDVSGWLMIPFAAGLFVLVIWYASRLTREVKLVTVDDLLQDSEQ